MLTSLNETNVLPLRRTNTCVCVCDRAGSMREIDVIDVARQQDGKMLMRDWTEYYNGQHRRKIFNVISLEFSNTK